MVVFGGFIAFVRKVALFLAYFGKNWFKFGMVYHRQSNIGLTTILPFFVMRMGVFRTVGSRRPRLTAFILG